MADKDQTVGSLSITQRWKEFVAGFHARLFAAMLYTPNGDSMADDTADAVKTIGVAGTALIGKVGIDQTTDGTTNRVNAKIANIESKTNATGTAAIAASKTVAASTTRRLISVSCHLSAAPTTAGSLTITLNANAGAAYDTLLLSQPMVGVTDLLWIPDAEIILEAGDAIDVAYTNADSRTYGVQITFEGA